MCTDALLYPARDDGVGFQRRKGREGVEDGRIEEDGDETRSECTSPPSTPLPLSLHPPPNARAQTSKLLASAKPELLLCGAALIYNFSPTQGGLNFVVAAARWHQTKLSVAWGEAPLAPHRRHSRHCHLCQRLFSAICVKWPWKLLTAPSIASTFAEQQFNTTYRLHHWLLSIQILELDKKTVWYVWTSLEEKIRTSLLFLIV